MAQSTTVGAGAAGPGRVLVISGSVGAGHDGAADELIARLDKLGVSTSRRDYLDALPRFGRVMLRRGYSLSIEYAPGFFDWLFVSLERAGWVRRLAFCVCFLARRRVRRWARESPVVVSTYPLASQTLGQLRASGALASVAVTYLTDPAVHRMWVHPAVDVHLTVTEASARMGRLTYRTPTRAVGGLVSPRFTHQLTHARRVSLRAELGLNPELPVVLVVTGSLGLGDVAGAVREIAATKVAQVLVLCGHNARLRAQLGQDNGIVALGWREDVPELMTICDVLVHNAGGLSVTEALTCGLPVVTFRPIPGHGTANAATLSESGLAPWPKTATELAALVREHARLPVDPTSVIHDVDAAAVVLELLADDPQQRANNPATSRTA